MQFMSIKERIECNVCILIFKMVDGLCLNYLTNKIELVSYPEYKVHKKNNIRIHKCKRLERSKEFKI